VRNFGSVSGLALLRLTFFPVLWLGSFGLTSHFATSLRFELIMENTPVDFEQLKEEIFAEWREIQVANFITESPWFVRFLLVLAAIAAQESLPIVAPVLFPALISWALLFCLLELLLLFGFLKRGFGLLRFLWYADSNKSSLNQ
jgi:hypothetical protein